MSYVALAPFGYVNAEGQAIHIARIGVVVELDNRTAKPLLKSGVIVHESDAKAVPVQQGPPTQESPDDDGVDFDEVVEVFWPDASDSKDDWVDMAVRLGVSRSAARAMSKSELIESLSRLDNSSE